MKNSIIICIACMSLCIASFAQTADKDIIKKVCTAESQAYHDQDYDAWAKYHVQSADEQLAYNNPDGSYGYETGWDKISKDMKEWFRSNKKDDAKISNDEFVFTIRGDMAFVAYNSSVQSPDGKNTKLREHRIFLRIKGQWKIIAVQAFVDHTSGK
jgi:ketosteroid isomerase-like protein